MSRNLKNLIMILLILAVGGAVIITANYAKSNSGGDKNMNGAGGSNISDAMPNNSNSNNMEQPPEKPDENSQNDSKNSDESINSSDSKTSDYSNRPSDSNMQPPEMNNSMQQNSSEANLSIYYLLFGIESFIIALLIAYLIMSGFNKKNFRKTLINKDKTTIYILLSLVLTFSLTFLISFFTNKYINSGNNKMSVNNNQNNNTSSNVGYSNSNKIDSDKDITSGEYSSSKSFENALLVTGNIKANLSNITVNKTGDSDGGDNTSFYGTNSAILAKGGANLTLKNITVETNSTGSNGVFSYGGNASTNNTSSDNTTVTISNSKITTKKDNSGGIMTTGGGIMEARNLTITTNGISSAAIRTDRGGGTVNVKEGTYTTTNQGSPSIYSTAKISVSSAKLISKASEGIVIEGKNSVSIDNTTLTDTNNKLNGKSTTYKNIFIYQSMSGDASSGRATFKASNSKITTNKGDSFYVTNTSAKITLSNNEITNNDKNGNLLRIKKDSWGNEGSNGGNVEFNMKNQKAEGNIVVDNISTLKMNLKNNSSYKGSINNDKSVKNITLKLDKTSKITLTGDSYVTSLEDDDTSYSNINFNGYKLYVSEKAIN